MARDKVVQLSDGEPWTIDLKPLPDDPPGVLSGNDVHVCCHCNLRHVVTFSVKRTGRKSGKLTLRFYQT